MLMEECGVYGVYMKNNENAIPYVVEGLIALQHRGQESAGVAYVSHNEIKVYKKMGMVAEIFNNGIMKKLDSSFAIGHVRYSTKGKSEIQNSQPFHVRFKNDHFAIAHNGQIENAEELRLKLEEQGTIFLTESDTELILHILIKNLRKNINKWTLEDVANIIFKEVSPSYSLLLLFKDRIIAIRDKYGYRPLYYYVSKEGFFISSEDSGFYFLNSDVNKIYEIMPGEAVEFSEEGIKKIKIKSSEKRYCFFEHIYFARPDSNVFGRNVHLIREELGKLCAKENPVDADIVVPVLDSGFSAALDYSKESKIPIEMGLMRNRYIGRTFISPNQEDREIGVKRKLPPISQVIKDKRIVLVDDSIVRGTTMKKIVNMIKAAGAKEVHVRVASPKVLNTCHWGVDIPDKNELIAAYMDIEELKNEFNADSVGYVSLSSINELLKEDFKNYCFHCFVR
ncbi:amidophosphoribosyltransferase [Marinitoga hydrogenitolerans DSM 16785]|uniref:Amidophosphoribosyltransferase n=1 Tax=Marinitoga hydrogenitolerans (strain DSM 16785 / JCM 12826 / AT1271) TaxID=1122195 RepID=A0A1M4YV51_MARH1|nr:amidophosphoribosyltransferase [Marinitoga hydrogenitolerans]SHF09568.1 amidophosphoribosyltransferase [Marinitoga hydrogenitolerans DSM 16785]